MKRASLGEGKKLGIGLGLVKLKMPIRHPGRNVKQTVWLYKLKFREFTHPSTVLHGSTVFNLPLREHPYLGKKNEYKLKMLKIFEQ